MRLFRAPGLRRCGASALAACARLCVSITTRCLDTAEALDPTPRDLAHVEATIHAIWARLEAERPYRPSHAERAVAAFVARHNQPAWLIGQTAYLCPFPTQERRTS